MDHVILQRIEEWKNKLPKEHFVDARCIASYLIFAADGTIYDIKKVRCHLRQLNKMSIGKGGYQKNNHNPNYVFGYQLFDGVQI